MYATLTDMQAIEYRQLFRWYIDLTEVYRTLSVSTRGPAGTDSDVTDDQSAKYFNDRLAFMCESVGLPEKDIESVTASIQGVQVEVACIPSVKGTKEFTFLDYVDGFVLRALLSWQRMSSATGKNATIKKGRGILDYTRSLPPILNTLGGYKFDIPAYMLDSQKNIQLMCVFQGAWAKTVTAGGDLSSDSSELAKPVVTISYDNCYYDTPD